MASEIQNLVKGTGDAAFAIDESGVISAWNEAAEKLFGFSSSEAMGKPCHKIIQGTGDGLMACAEDCAIRKAAAANQPETNFDLQVRTVQGGQWCNISILLVAEPRSGLRHAVHIVHPREMRRRLEQLIRDFVVNEAQLNKLPGGSGLSTRELEILRRLAKGSTTDKIAEELFISSNTVKNHIRHILAKLNAHSRLEAIRRAEQAGLI